MECFKCIHALMCLKHFKHHSNHNFHDCSVPHVFVLKIYLDYKWTNPVLCNSLGEA